MKSRISTLTAITLVAALGSGAMTSTSFAHDHPRDGGERGHNMGQPHDGGPMHKRGQARNHTRGGLPLMTLTCAPDAAERFETLLDTIGERLDLTDEQSAVFADFQTAALSAQTSFSDTCDAFAGVDRDSDVEPDLIDRLTQRQLMLSARVEAMDDVLPALETLYDSLTDAQQAELMPNRGDRQGQRGFRPSAAPETPAAE